ncbi:unnamed protein product [Trifolium pratense]|uniref:Uncharacterized protein n=1 Tax=Trifolium pratense TaxID=57577 RepID=A0ACB0JJF7_TRIPR|nr:unnamed protein product [Trifolium pratense]
MSVENYFEDHKYVEHSKDKLHEVKEEWTDYMVTNILPGAKCLSLFLIARPRPSKFKPSQRSCSPSVCSFFFALRQIFCSVRL